MIGSRGGDCKEFFLECRPVCIGEVFAGTDRDLNGVGGYGDNDRDVVRRSCGAGS